MTTISQENLNTKAYTLIRNICNGRNCSYGGDELKQQLLKVLNELKRLVKSSSVSENQRGGAKGMMTPVINAVATTAQLGIGGILKIVLGVTDRVLNIVMNKISCVLMENDAMTGATNEGACKELSNLSTEELTTQFKFIGRVSKLMAADPEVHDAIIQLYESTAALFSNTLDRRDAEFAMFTEPLTEFTKKVSGRVGNLITTGITAMMDTMLGTNPFTGIPWNSFKLFVKTTNMAIGSADDAVSTVSKMRNIKKKATQLANDAKAPDNPLGKKVTEAKRQLEAAKENASKVIKDYKSTDEIGETKGQLAQAKTKVKGQISKATSKISSYASKAKTSMGKMIKKPQKGGGANTSIFFETDELLI
jgi:hypothetical protein